MCLPKKSQLKQQPKLSSLTSKGILTSNFDQAKEFIVKKNKATNIIILFMVITLNMIFVSKSLHR